MVTDVSNGPAKDFETSALGSISGFLWLNSSTIEEDKSEAAFHLSFFPEYFEADHGVRAVIQHEDIFSSLLDHPPQKLVSIGPEHQALIPEWAPQLLENSLDYSDTSGFMNGGKEEELMGTIIIPMPDWEPLAYNFCKGGGIGNECNCLHVGSISCTRQHVMEARQRLRENLGQDMFEKLGFCDMGEEVADKWSEDEEHAFDEVVLSYPASLDKNFWDHLSGIFPSRTKKDLVSYYFNVFMLRKRAEQNRFDPLNIDSDNDEWQRSELGMVEEDTGFLVESQIDQDTLTNFQGDHAEGCYEDIKG